MSAPLITRLFGPASNVQTSYYNLVNAPLAIAMGLLLGVAPLMRWRSHEPAALLRAALPAVVVAALVTIGAMVAGVRELLPIGVIFGAAFALAANSVVTVRGFRSGWKHGVAYLGHLGVAVLLIGVVASSNYGRDVQVQLPRGQERAALGYRLTFTGTTQDGEGKDHVMIAVNAPERKFSALPAMYWSEFNRGYMKKPHIERFLTHDIYISPLEMVGNRPEDAGVWFSKGETKTVGTVQYTFVEFDARMGDVVRVAAKLRAQIGGRTVAVEPVLEMGQSGPNRIPAYLPGGGTVQIVSVDAENGRVALELPGGPRKSLDSEILAVEVSTKPLINLVWLGAIIMLASAFMSMIRRILDLRRGSPPPAAPAVTHAAAE
jgi:cytochrome c-type biogenesis protein CcmF